MITALDELCELALALGLHCLFALAALCDLGELSLARSARSVSSRSRLGQLCKLSLALREGLLGRGELRPLFLQLGEE